ncbi:hypothetical protein [Enterococcus casseliflavus]|nr:hypothetical protein [Enterococcus casseliflavus]
MEISGEFLLTLLPIVAIYLGALAVVRYDTKKLEKKIDMLEKKIDDLNK